MKRNLAVGLLVLMLLTAQAKAWPWSSSACCDKEGWYALNGGPMSWLCPFPSRAELRILAMRTYIGQGDYEAAKKVATELIHSKACYFIPGTPTEHRRLDFHAYEARPNGDPAAPAGMTVIRVRGSEVQALVFRDALVADDPLPEFDIPAQLFVDWARQTTQANRGSSAE